MLIQSASRKEFLDVTQGKGNTINLIRSERVYRLGNEELLLVWRGDSPGLKSLPDVVVVDDERQRDFLAWVWTYVPTIRPLTAYSRVVSEAVADRASRRASEPTLGSLQGAALGLILGEAVTHLSLQSDAKRFSLLACESTYSFSLARGMAVEAIDDGYNPIADAWKRLRKLGHHASWSISPEEIQRPWDVVLKLRSAYPDPYASDNLTVVSACKELYRDGDVGSSTWDQITKGNITLRRAKDESRGPIEDRVRAVEQALDTLVDSKSIFGETGEFLAGYLTSRIGPGTIDHINLLIPRLVGMPAAILWYGLCAGLQPGSRLEDYSKGLGRRVLRELLRSEHFLDNPRCDIALNELEMLSSATDASLRDIVFNRQNNIEVEVAPCVSTVVRWPPRPAAPDPSIREHSHTEQQAYEADRQLSMLKAASGSAALVSDTIVQLERTLAVLRTLRDGFSHALDEPLGRPPRKRARRR